MNKILWGLSKSISDELDSDPDSDSEIEEEEVIDSEDSELLSVELFFVGFSSTKELLQPKRSIDKKERDISL